MLETASVPQNNDHKIVRFTNIADFDFVPEMGAMYGGVPYFVSAGKSMLMPLSIADHLATHLSRQIIIKKAPIRDDKEIDGKGSDRKLWEPQHIVELKGKIVSSEIYQEERPAPTTPEQVLARKVEELNKAFPPDVIAAAAKPLATPEVEKTTTSIGIDTPAPAAEKTITMSSTAPVTPIVQVTPPTGPIVYKDKAEVIAELNKRGLKFDARKSKADLEKLLVTPVAE